MDSFCLIYTDLLLWFSSHDADVERNVFLMEQKHGFIRDSWASDSEQYQLSLELAVCKRREALICKIRQGSFDRKFLISSLHKYGSMFFFLLVLLLFLVSFLIILKIGISFYGVISTVWNMLEGKFYDLMLGMDRFLNFP